MADLHLKVTVLRGLACKVRIEDFVGWAGWLVCLFVLAENLFNYKMTTAGLEQGLE